MQTAFFVPPSGEILMLTIGHVLSPSGRFIQRRYRGLAAEQYRSFAGKGGAEQDTLKEYHTDAGRLVRGGGGIAPDVELPRPAQLPVWWSVATDSGFDDAISDSVAMTLAATAPARTQWLTATDQWRTRLLAPFLARVRARLRVTAQTDSALDARLAFALAARVAEVRWGPDAFQEFVFRPTMAMSYFARLPELLAAPHR